MKARRRLVFQLVPLLDLMLTVIFLQYLAVREREEETRAAAASAESTAQDLAGRVATLETEAREATVRGNQAVERQAAMGRLLATMFDVPEAKLNEILETLRTSPVGDSLAERNALREKVQGMANATPGQMVHHLLTYEEIRKRCDVWELHISAESVATLDTGDRQPRLRINLSENEAVEIERFGDDLVSLYRGLPQPKSLVIILLTYDRQTRLAVTEAVAGALPGVVDKMRQAGGGLTRFEFADLGVRLK